MKLIQLQNKYSIELLIMHPPQNKILNKNISIDLSCLVGKGATGNVYRGLSLEPHPHPIAIKVIPLKEINNQVTSYLLNCELEALKALSTSGNQNVVKLKEIIVIDQQCFIAMELLEGGTLTDFISKRQKIQETTALTLLKQILEGYKNIKNNGIVHRDLKPGNIMFERNPEQILPLVKIIDFGYCQVDKVKNKPKMFYNVGSPRYMSPEAYKENVYSEKSDVWSIGIIFYQMLIGSTFDKGREMTETLKMIKEKGIPIPTKLTTKSKKLLQSMLMYSPLKRASVEKILEILNEEEPFPEIRSQIQNVKRPTENTIASLEKQNRNNIRILSVPRPQPSDNMASYKSLNKIEQSMKNFNSNKVLISHLKSPKIGQQITFNNRKKNNVSIDKVKNQITSLKGINNFETSPNKDEAYLLNSANLVKINITTMQPSASKLVSKENEKIQNKQYIVRSHAINRPTQSRKIHQEISPFKNDYHTYHKLPMNSPKKLFQSAQFQQPLTPPVKDTKSFKPKVSFYHQEHNVASEIPMNSILEGMSTPTAFTGLPQRKTMPDMIPTSDKPEHYFQLRSTIDGKTQLR